MAFSVELKPNLLTSKDFSIDEESVIYDDTQMMCSEITGLTYGIEVSETNLIGPKTIYRFRLVDNAGDELDIKFYATVLLDLNAGDVSQTILNEMWNAFGTALYNRAIEKIRSGNTIQIGPLSISRSAVEFPVKFLFGNEEIHAVEWKNLNWKIENGAMVLQSRESKNTRIKVDMIEHYNGVFLIDLFGEFGTNNPA